MTDRVSQTLRTCFISEAQRLAGIDEMKCQVCVHQNFKKPTEDVLYALYGILKFLRYMCRLRWLNRRILMQASTCVYNLRLSVPSRDLLESYKGD
jgi:hypothetical protein